MMEVSVMLPTTGGVGGVLGCKLSRISHRDPVSIGVEQVSSPRSLAAHGVYRIVIGELELTKNGGNCRGDALDLYHVSP
jgi:hypothetical protein